MEMSTLLTTKDFLTVVFAGIAILLSAGALWVSIRNARLALNASIRPVIYVELKHDNETLKRFLIAQNIGCGHAYDVTFKIKGSIRNEREKSDTVRIFGIQVDKTVYVPTKIFEKFGDFPANLKVKVICKNVLGKKQSLPTQSWEKNLKVSGLFTKKKDWP